jgi:transposase
MLLRIAVNKGEAVTRTYGTSREGRERAIAELRRRAEAAGGAEVVFAYEASLFGYGLYDDVTEAGMRCYVLAPTRIAHTAKSRQNKCDEKDASRHVGTAGDRAGPSVCGECSPSDLGAGCEDAG